MIVYTRVAGFPVFEFGFELCFCSYQANISVENASAKLSSSDLCNGIRTTAGTAETVPAPGLLGNSGGTLSREVEDRWLPDPDPGLSDPGTRGDSLSVDLKLLALAFRNLVEYL